LTLSPGQLTDRFGKKVHKVPDEFDVVIAGSGIAGLTAGLTAARLGRRTLVLTGDMPGGQLVSIEAIHGYPGFPDGAPGHELCPMLHEQASSAGAEFVMAGLDRIESRGGVWRIAAGEEDIATRAVVLATGSSLKKLNVPGEDRFFGKGVSQCASCDGPLFRDRVVAVIGGGDSAMQEALTLGQFAAKVLMISSGSELMGQAVYRDRVRDHEKIETRFNTATIEILGNDKVEGLRVRDTVTGADADFETSAVFVYVGLQPNTASVSGLTALDADGRIPVDAQMRTALPGVCAAGNIRSGSPCRAVSAAGDGANAAAAIDRYLADGRWCGTP
jgi:thioredoxin reductase (NADPH)